MTARASAGPAIWPATDCARIGEPPISAAADVVRSPDDKWEAFTRDHNIWLRSLESGEERAITTDGEAKNDYGEYLLSPLTSAGIDDPPPPFIKWSPDSGKLLFCRIDQREAPQFHLVQSVPHGREPAAAFALLRLSLARR